MVDFALSQFASDIRFGLFLDSDSDLREVLVLLYTILAKAKANFARNETYLGSPFALNDVMVLFIGESATA